jgi:hypothetical protein
MIYTNNPIDGHVVLRQSMEVCSETPFEKTRYGYITCHMRHWLISMNDAAILGHQGINPRSDPRKNLRRIGNAMFRLAKAHQHDSFSHGHRCQMSFTHSENNDFTAVLFSRIS